MAVTIRDVASVAGVSISTVSRALASPDMVSEATRTLVENTARAMGYRPNRAARGLITGRTGSIGLVVPDLENPFFGSICKGVQARARAAGYAVFIADTDEDPIAESEIVRGMARQVDGVIVASARGADAEIQSLAAITPLVLVNRQVDGVRSITFDNPAGLRAVMSHLVALGHRKIAYAGGPQTSWSNQQRTTAFAEFGRTSPDLELVQLGNFSPDFEGGVSAGDLAIASGATAVAAFNDIMALGLIDRLRQRGLSAPKDISVTGFDNVSFSTFAWPNLTTVDFPCVIMGRASVDSILDSILAAEPSLQQARSIPVQLIVRQSTGVLEGGPAVSPTSPALEYPRATATTVDRDPVGTEIH